MSIAIAHPSLAAPLAANATAVAAGSRIAVIAQALARILDAAGNASNSAAPAQSSAAIILTQLLIPTNPLGSSNGAAPMELNLNQLLNGALLQKTLTQLPPELLARPQVIEAIVLQNTLLPAAAGKEQSALPLLNFPARAGAAANAAPNGTLYRINIEWQNKLIQLLSPQPLPTGSRVPLQIDARGVISLLPPEMAARVALAQNLSASAPPAPAAPPSAAQHIQQSLRELLPRQQALHTLVPLLQRFVTPAVREQLPAPVFKALAQLLQSLPKPAQLHSAENVKQALHNSGSFLEARIVAAANQTDNAEPLPRIAATDVKAQIAALLTLVRGFAPPSGAAAKTHVPAQSLEDDFVYTKPAVLTPPPELAGAGESEPLDTLLAQLGKLLSAGLARIQLNQLDSANARLATPDTPQPVPTWVLELPLRTPHGVDQLQLRIEQQHKRQQQRSRVQWNVELAFDLHAAGKIAASLAIVDKSVAATLWAEHEQTHRRVREEMDYLRAGLESVGVKVTEMQCRLGLPAPRSHPVSQQLVDVHT